MEEDIRLRQSTLIDGKKLGDNRLCIVGVGGVGSHLALALARMGVTDMILCDNDIVDVVNVSSQGFDIDDIGKNKASVTAEKIFNAVRSFPKTIESYITKDNLDDSDVYVLAVDSMSSKLELMEAIADNSSSSTILVPAMGAEYFTLDVYTGDTAKSLELFNSRYFTDEEASSDPCTAKATIYTTLLASSFICKAIKDINECNDYTSRVVYDICNNTPVIIKSSNGKLLK